MHLLNTFLTLLLRLGQALAPATNAEHPRWFYRCGRGLLSLWLVTLPFWFDINVPEVSGDPRWAVTHATVMILSTLGLYALWQRGKITLTARLPWLGWVMLGLFFTASLSLLDTVNPFRSWWFYKHFVSFIGLFSFIYILRHTGWYRTLLWLLILPLFPITLLGICQFLDITDAQVAAWLPGWQYIGPIDWLRATFPQSAAPAGTFANKNLAASWTVLLLPLVFYQFFTARRFSLRLFMGILLTLGVVFLIFSRSRASWLSFAFALLFLGGWVLLHRPVREQLKQTLHWQMIPIAIASLVMVVLAYPLKSPLNAHGINISVKDQVVNLSNLADFGPRISYTINGVKMTLDNPLTGVGIGAFHTAFPPYYNAWFKTPPNGYNVEARPQRAHNDLMQAFIEQGILGGLLHLAAVFITILYAWRLARPPASPAAVPAAFLLAGVMGLSFNALGDFPLQMPTAPALLFLCLGMMAGLAALHQREATVGWHKSLVLTKPVLFLAVLAALMTTGLVIRDDYQRREGAKHLKTAMARTLAGLTDDGALEAIRKSYQAYRWNARMMEFRSIIYSQYSGKKPLSQLRREEVILESLKYDPYAANHLINLGGLYHRMAERQIKLGNLQAASQTLAKIDPLIPRLMQVADFSFHTWNIQALLALRRGQRARAAELFEKAYTLNPQDPTSRNALRGLGKL
jgi:O-antigen ligase